ncbi:hypothetical protein Y032_0374g213 [Ancylostoma ceylanicum]|uniref:Uncharacterized protein n=1 Tax=Ancylostoma ceylanicum TaxID=53326 RepID=A0A016RUI7_9BILA|nr:hypothetical protein Y032_0374g213 [Ancylostoma ceylanicum]
MSRRVRTSISEAISRIRGISLLTIAAMGCDPDDATHQSIRIFSTTITLLLPALIYFDSCSTNGVNSSGTASRWCLFANAKWCERMEQY